MIKIEYQGPLGVHIVVSPLRQVKSYGLHTRGDIFEVTEADQKARPELFKIVKEKKSVVEEKPQEKPEDAQPADEVKAEETLEVKVEEKAEAAEPPKPTAKKKPASKKH